MKSSLPGPVLPAQPQVDAEAVAPGVVLDEAAEEHARCERVVDAGQRHVVPKGSLRQIDPVERESRLEGEPVAHVDAPRAQPDRRFVAPVKAPPLEGECPRVQPLQP